MARLKITNLNKVKAFYKKKVIKALRHKKVREQLASDVVESIMKTTYRNVSSSEPYHAYRERIMNSKHPKHSSRKINLTITGELLEDLIKNIKFSRAKGNVTYVMEHSNKNHKPYKLKTGETKSGKAKGKVSGRQITTKSGRKKTVGAKYEDIRRGLYDAGYKYLADIDDTVLEKSINKVRKILLDILST